MSAMPEQPHIVKYCDQELIHPQPRHPVPIIEIERIAANAEKQASPDLAFASQQQPQAQQQPQPQSKPDQIPQRKRKDSAAPSLHCCSPVLEKYEQASANELLATSHSPKHVPEHFSNSGLLEAGFNQETSRRNSNWRRFFCKPPIVRESDEKYC